MQNVLPEVLKGDRESGVSICEIHGEYNSTWLHVGRWSRCPECERISKEKREAEMLKVESRERTVKAINGSLIPPRYKTKSFDNYIAPNNSPAARSRDSLADYATMFGENIKNGSSAVLLGKCGTGKTHLAAAVGNYILNNGYTVKYMTMYDAVGKFKETFNNRDISEESVLKVFADPDLLIIDEAGVGFGSTSEEIFMYRMINRRYEQMKPTMVCANLTIEEFSDKIGERVLDRLMEGGGPVLVFDWDSYRMNG